MPNDEVEEGRAAAARELESLQQELAPKLDRLRKLRRLIRERAAPGSPTYAEHLVALLEARKEPTSPGALLDALLAAGVIIGGASRKDQQTTIAITLKRNRAFKKVARGLYGLASWDHRAA